ncbi:MAG: sensor histidine kinase [Gaiellales bacterium]
MSEPMRILALLGPITIATVLSSIAARSLVRRAGLAATMVAIAVVASLVTVIDLLVLNHFMLINPGNRTEVGLVALYSLTAGVAAAMIVGRSTNRAIRRLVGVARSLGHNDLDARVGNLEAGPELQVLADTLDQTAARLARMIEAERQVEAERRDLMTSISHDLRTPLANLRAMVEAISDGVVDDADTIRLYAGDMQRSIMTLVEMVEDLFELSSLDTHEFAADDRLIPLCDAVQQAVGRCSAEAAAKGIRLDVDLGEVSAQPCSPKLARVVHSLVDNAVRYTPPGGHVTVRAAAAPDGLQVAVEDSGQGISADQLPRVFEPFWRADSARSSRGSGLGLTLAKRIVEALGGKIEATSGPDQGSRFDITVPT